MRFAAVDRAKSHTHVLAWNDSGWRRFSELIGQGVDQLVWMILLIASATSFTTTNTTRLIAAESSRDRCAIIALAEV